MLGTEIGMILLGGLLLRSFLDVLFVKRRFVRIFVGEGNVGVLGAK